ncbi:MAG: hypothetical protein IPF57_18260 [Gammaproteobacteria bacterium]|nr:hypothetical protein [Gammaproteobacteria bacterium]MBK8993024.1 hypothetical protein [Gammaproteobacteria bacterium]MBP6480041.1 hypothetical protein [Pseudomonadales bacterium]MBP7908382.1 hypothetical protein [Pseudomonadales bacterium]
MSDSMNKRELAAAMRVSTTTVDNWLNRGCPFRKAPDGATVGEGYQFDLAEVQHWLDRRDRRGAGRPGSSSGRTWADALRLRPDWRNLLRFMAETAVMDFLTFYMSEPRGRVFFYAAMRLQGVSSAEAAEGVTNDRCGLFNSYFAWIKADSFNKFNQKANSSLDEQFELLTGERIATRPPTDDDTIGRSVGLPAWVRLSDDATFAAELEAEYQELIAQLEANQAQAAAD